MSRFNLQTKLLLLCFFLSVIAVVGGVGLLSNRTVSQEYGGLIDNTLPKVNHMQELYTHFLSIRMNLRNLGLPGISAQEAADSEKQVQESLQKIAQARKDYEALGFAPGQKELFEKQQAAWADFFEVGKRVLAHHKGGTPEDRQKMVQIFFTDCPETAGRFMAASQALFDFHEKEVKASTADAEAVVKNSSLLAILMIAFGVLVGLVLGFIFSRSLSRSLNKISDAISDAASQTSGGAQQLSSASSQLSSASTEAAASLEETVASLEELSSMVRLNTGNAQQANGLSQKSKEAAENGEVEIAKLIEAMSDIAKGSKKIEEIIAVIDDIAFQTNLLALNAAVEAARAGEQGKSFAVVAEAVRSLAQRSSVAAKDISSLIKDNVVKTEHGAKIADSSGVVLKEILSSIKKVADLNNEIAAGSEEQLQGIEQISKAMNQLDQATQGNAASSEQVAASSEGMAEEGQKLSEMANVLKAIVLGDKQGTHTPPASTPVKETKHFAPSHHHAPTHHKVTLKAVKPPTNSPAKASNVIPFDDDDGGRGNIGDVSGF